MCQVHQALLGSSCGPMRAQLRWLTQLRLTGSSWAQPHTGGGSPCTLAGTARSACGPSPDSPTIARLSQKADSASAPKTNQSHFPEALGAVQGLQWVGRMEFGRLESRGGLAGLE